MNYYMILRETQVNEQSSLCKFVARFDSLSEAMSKLYCQARRFGYEVAVDNSVPGYVGFCLWQIHVQVGPWRYFVTAENDEMPPFGWDF